MSGYYRIMEAQRPLILGLAGHDLLVVLNPLGQEIEEFDGLATSANGAIKPIGYLPSDTLKVYELSPSSPYAQYASNESQAQVASSTTLAGLQPYINAMVTCQNDMNAENLSYPFLGLGANSNSVASTLDACMGVKEPSIPNSALITPGVGTLLLPTSTITSVQQANGLAQISTTGDNAVSSDTTGATTSTVNVTNSDGTTEAATITTSGGAGDATLTNKNSAGTVVGTETDVIQSTGSQTITITGIGQANADGATIYTPAKVTDTVIGNNDLINISSIPTGKGGGGPIGGTVDVSGTGNTIAGSDATVNIETAGTTFSMDTAFNSIINGDNYTGLNVTVLGASIPQYTGTVAGFGTDSTITMDKSYDNVTVASGDTVNFAASTTSEVMNGSGDTVTEGSSSNANIKGSNDTITLGTADNVLASGTGDHIVASSGDVIDLAANETVTVTGSGDTIVGTTGDTINVTGTSDQIYADTSNIEILGTDTGDIVNGSGDTGDRANWGGYVSEGGGYGGYGGGGYYYAATARKKRALAASVAGSGSTGLSGVGIDALAANDRMLGKSMISEIYMRKSATQSVSAQIPSQVSVKASPLVTASSHASTQQLVQAMARWPVGAVSALSDAFSTGHPGESGHLLIAQSSRLMKPGLSAA